MTRTSRLIGLGALVILSGCGSGNGGDVTQPTIVSPMPTDEAKAAFLRVLKSEKQIGFEEIKRAAEAYFLPHADAHYYEDVFAMGRKGHWPGEYAHYMFEVKSTAGGEGTVLVEVILYKYKDNPVRVFAVDVGVAID